MLTSDELSALEGLLTRARGEAAIGRIAATDTITAGDVVQLRPGASHLWETSLMLVTQTTAEHIKGQILRPHRGGCREAWYTFTPPELTRVGRIPFPEPAPDIKAWCYAPPCSLIARPAELERYRRLRSLSEQNLRDEQIRVGEEAASRRRRRKQA